MNVCIECSKDFQSWFDYHEHLSLANCLEPIQVPIVESTMDEVFFPVRQAITGQYEPMDLLHKRQIVRRVERRLGKLIIDGSKQEVLQ